LTFVNLPLYILQQNWLHKVKVLPAYTAYETEKTRQCVLKRRHMKFRRRGITQKKEYNKIIYVCLSVRQHSTDSFNFNIEGCYKNLQRKSKFGSKWTQISDIYMEAKVCFNVLQATLKRYEINVGSDMQQNIV
jgi:hypothetical protein